MKAGVITFHSAHNFGASLQTWALQQALADLGVEPCVINYHTPVIDNLYDPIKETNPKLRAKKIKQLQKKNPASLLRYERYSKFIEDNFNLFGNYTCYEENFFYALTTRSKNWLFPSFKRKRLPCF